MEKHVKRYSWVSPRPRTQQPAGHRSDPRPLASAAQPRREAPRVTAFLGKKRELRASPELGFAGQ